MRHKPKKSRFVLKTVIDEILREWIRFHLEQEVLYVQKARELNDRLDVVEIEESKEVFLSGLDEVTNWFNVAYRKKWKMLIRLLMQVDFDLEEFHDAYSSMADFQAGLAVLGIAERNVREGINPKDWVFEEPDGAIWLSDTVLLSLEAEPFGFYVFKGVNRRSKYRFFSLGGAKMPSVVRALYEVSSGFEEPVYLKQIATGVSDALSEECSEESVRNIVKRIKENAEDDGYNGFIVLPKTRKGEVRINVNALVYKSVEN